MGMDSCVHIGREMISARKIKLDATRLHHAENAGTWTIVDVLLFICGVEWN